MRALAAGAAVSVAAFALIAAIAGIGSGREAGTAAGDAPGRAVATADSQSGRMVFARMGCGSCHTLAAAGSRGEIGPDLDQRLPTHDRASLIAKITMTPPEGGGETFSAMPQNFGERMNAAELDALVDFLLAQRRER